MGSDATEKSHRSGILRRLYYLSQTTKITACSLISLLVFLILKRLATDDFELSHTFSPTDLSHVPDRCLDLATRFHQCQENPKHKQPVVLACHRKWCHSYGHCEPCAGVGDRTLHMLSLVQEALTRCIRVELDYPLTGIQLVSDAVYHDPIYGPFLGNLLHRRSYDVTPRTVDINKWGDEKAFVHFTPDHYSYIPYDMCLFHILFRPIPPLQEEIQYHRQQMGQNVIGIHFRVGDAASFGYDNKDVRTHNVEESFFKMLDCGHELAEKLFEPDEYYSFFLATDNAKAKQLARDVDDSRFSIYQTDVRPALYVSLDAERDAWMEVYLLSMTQGLVVNVRPKNYEGKAGRLSMFSQLAKRIGFIGDEAIMECHID